MSNAERFLQQNNLIIDPQKIINYQQFCEAINTTSGSTSKRKAIYLGIDPTSDKLHIGHLIQLIMLNKLAKYFDIIIVLGTSTGQIGDPSGKRIERNVISPHIVSENMRKIRLFIKSLSFCKDVMILENDTWMNKISFVDFIRGYCKCLNMAFLLNKVNIKTRITTGLSVAEFLYTILQAIDFWQLFQKYNCVGQMGGSDQRGNIINGITLINVLTQEKQKTTTLFGITTELLTDRNGIKMGKTNNNQIHLTNNYIDVSRLFNYLYNLPDDKVLEAFQLFTLLTYEQQQELFQQKKQYSPTQKFLQSKLAEIVVSQIATPSMFRHLMFLAKTLYQTKYIDLSEENWEQIQMGFNYTYEMINSEKGVHWLQIRTEQTRNLSIINFVVKNNICHSRKNALQLISSNAFTINNFQLKLLDGQLTIHEFFENNNFKLRHQIFIVKLGKRRIFIIKMTT